MRALGFNTVNAYEFDGLGPTNINNTLNANGLSNGQTLLIGWGR